MFVQDRTTHGHYPSLFDINHLFMVLLDIGYNYGLYNNMLVDAMFSMWIKKRKRVVVRSSPLG